MSTFYGRRYYDDSDSLAHFFYTGNSGSSIKSSKDKKEAAVKTEKTKESSGGGTRKKRDLNGESISNERGTDGKQNNTSEYNHEYYEENPEKWDDDKKSNKSTSKKSKSKNNTKTKSKEEQETKDTSKEESKETSDAQNESEKDENSILKDKDLDEVALDVIRGKYGNGNERKIALGKDYATIQRRVNEMIKNKEVSMNNTKSSSNSSNTKTNTTNKDASGGGSRV